MADAHPISEEMHQLDSLRRSLELLERVDEGARRRACTPEEDSVTRTDEGNCIRGRHHPTAVVGHGRAGHHRWASAGDPPTSWQQTVPAALPMQAHRYESGYRCRATAVCRDAGSVTRGLELRPRPRAERARDVLPEKARGSVSAASRANGGRI